MSANPININAVMANWVDRGLWYYYDTLSITQGAAGAASYSMFSVPVGQSSKTRTQTNMRVGNRFPPPTCLVLDQIGFYFSPDVLLADQILFMKNYRLEFKIDNKVYFEGLMWMYPPGLGVSGYSTKTAESAWGIGQPNFFSVRMFGDYGKYIAPDQLFEFNLICDGTAPTFAATAAGGVGVLLVPILHGLTDRSVQ